jgi:hypothetical protein
MIRLCVTFYRVLMRLPVCVVLYMYVYILHTYVYDVHTCTCMNVVHVCVFSCTCHVHSTGSRYTGTHVYIIYTHMSCCTYMTYMCTYVYMYVPYMYMT